MATWFEESVERLNQRSVTLQQWKRCAFIASICERLFPWYEAFVLTFHWGDSKTLRNALDIGWEFAQGQSLSKGEVRALYRPLAKLTPSLDDFDSIYDYPAICAVGTVEILLECCLNSNKNATIQATMKSLNAIRSYGSILHNPSNLLVPGDPRDDFWRLIEQSPYVVTELEKEQQDLNTLELYTESAPNLIAEFRKTAIAVGLNPIKHGFVIKPK